MRTNQRERLSRKEAREPLEAEDGYAEKICARTKRHTTGKNVERSTFKEGVIDCHVHIGLSFKAFVSDEFPYCMSLEDQIVRMNHLGVDFACVFPFPYSTYYKIPRELSTDIATTVNDYSTFPYELENRKICEEVHKVFYEYQDRVMLFLMFDPLREVKHQITHMRSLIESYPIFGLKTCTHQIKANILELDGIGRPIIDLACEYNLPVLCHASYHPGDTWANVYDILAIAEKYEKVRFCIAHSARFALDALERACQLPNVFVDTSAFDIHCKLARQDNIAIAEMTNRVEADYSYPENVLKILVDNYPDTIIWGSDTPFNHSFIKRLDSNGNLVSQALKSRYDTEHKILFSLSDEDRLRISYKNTMNFLMGFQQEVI